MLVAVVLRVGPVEFVLVDFDFPIVGCLCNRFDKYYDYAGLAPGFPIDIPHVGPSVVYPVARFDRLGIRIA